MTPSGGTIARTRLRTASIASGRATTCPVLSVASGGVGPTSGPAVVLVPCVPLMTVPPRLRHPLVGRQGEEVGVLVCHRRLHEGRSRVLPTALGEGFLPDPLPDAAHLVVDDLLHQLPGHLVAVGELHLVVQPLPDLAPRDLRC